MPHLGVMILHPVIPFHKSHKCSLPNIVIEETFLVIILYSAHKNTMQCRNFTLRMKSVLYNNSEYLNKNS